MPMGTDTDDAKPLAQATGEGTGSLGADPLSALNLSVLLESLPDAILVCNVHGKIVFWNRYAETVYGYSPQEVVGQPVHILFPAGQETPFPFLFADKISGEQWLPVDTLCITRHSEQILFSLLAFPIRDDAGQTLGAMIIVRRLSEGGQAQPHNNRLTSLTNVVAETTSRVATDILSSQSGLEALTRVVEAARILARAQYAALGIARPDGAGLLTFITAGIAPEDEKAIGPRPTGKGILDLLLGRAEPLRIDRLCDHPESVGFPPHHPAMESFLGVPIRHGETTLGSLYLTNKLGGGAFTELDEVAVQALGECASVAIHNHLLLARQRALGRGLIAAQEEERRALVYDLHDGLTQYVMAAHSYLDTARQAQEDGNKEKFAEMMAQGMRYLGDAVVESRRLVSGLRLLALDDIGLAGAVHQLCNEEKARAGWEQAELIHNIEGRQFDKTLETTAYRVVQEALTNARKHAQTSRAQVSLLTETAGKGPERLLVEVQDWGRGFIVSDQARDYGHIGLQGILERIQLVEGTCDILSAPGQGTIIRALFPLHSAPVEVEEGKTS